MAVKLKNKKQVRNEILLKKYLDNNVEPLKIKINWQVLQDN